MPNTLLDIPDADILLALAPEELAPILLRTVIAFRNGGNVHSQDAGYQLYEGAGGHTLETRFPRATRNRVELAISEAWAWLTVNGIIVPAPGTNGQNGWMVLSRRGSKLIDDPSGFGRFVTATGFPKTLLHPSIAEKVWLSLARGELDEAVFASFKAVEEAVRKAGNYKPTDIGVPLMRAAFDSDKGPLRDKAQPEPERAALAHLFAGAIGSYKNPHSHRTVSLSDALEAQEMVVLASHLLRIIDSRRDQIAR